jgi:hypothetical protein
MRKIKDILRLRHEAGLSYRGIAQSLNIGYGTVVDYLTRAKQAGLSWPIPEDLCERDLGRFLFPTQPVTGQRRFSEPDFPAIHLEQSFRRILALLSNAKKYGRDRLNKACARALTINSPTRSSVESILKQGLDQQPLTAEEAPSQDELFLDHHENLRGEEYYH